MGILEGKFALVTGVASNRSIAWGIAQALHREGAKLAFTYQNEKLRKRVESFASELGSNITLPCELTDDRQIKEVFERLKENWDGLDILIHSAAFAPREMLEGGYLDNLTREGFLMAHDISSYSFSALAKTAKPMMEGRNASMLTLSYLGSTIAMPNYNVMGVAKASLEANVRYMATSLGPENIRVNAISAGPIRTLAASGIKGLSGFLKNVSENSPLRRNVTIEEVGNVAAFLCSDMASAVTGEITFVDCGYNISGST